MKWQDEKSALAAEEKCSKLESQVNAANSALAQVRCVQPFIVLHEHAGRGTHPRVGVAAEGARRAVGQGTFESGAAGEASSVSHCDG